MLIFRKVLILLFLLTMLGCKSDSDEQQYADYFGGNTGFELTNLASAMESLPIETLSEEESNSILFMREEEKLARDAYILFYQLWGQKIFDNISSAEQTHMDALLLLIERYQLVDPITSDEFGIFINPELQNLYDLLAAQGSNSLIDALLAGAEIEEVDLLDLEIRLLVNDNQDVELIFENLMKGSRNHLRSFVSNLANQGVSYVPLHLSQEAFDAIINSPMERG